MKKNMFCWLLNKSTHKFTIFYKKTDEWYIKSQRVQRMTTSGTTSDNEWQRVVQRVTTNNNDRQRVVQRETTSERNDNEW